MVAVTREKRLLSGRCMYNNRRGDRQKDERNFKLSTSAVPRVKWVRVCACETKRSVQKVAKK